MKFPSLLFVFLFASLSQSFAQRINEFHYANIGADECEFIEIVLPAGDDPSQYLVYAVDGANGFVYFDSTLGAPEATINGEDYYLINIPDNRILQDGDPDGIALMAVSATPCEVIHFISYGGEIRTILCESHPPTYVTSEDVLVTENETTAVGASIEWDGVEWVSRDTHTKGALNAVRANPVPTMGQWMLFILGMLTAVIGLVTLYNNRSALA